MTKRSVVGSLTDLSATNTVHVGGFRHVTIGVNEDSSVNIESTEESSSTSAGGEDLSVVGITIDPTIRRSSSSSTSIGDLTSMTEAGDKLRFTWAPLSWSEHENPPPSEKGRLLHARHFEFSQPSNGQANFDPTIKSLQTLQETVRRLLVNIFAFLFEIVSISYLKPGVASSILWYTVLQNVLRT